jgi:serine phosphatase RsbU (regulator of sigma subunit)/PAS domain-containing protein
MRSTVDVREMVARFFSRWVLAAIAVDGALTLVDALLGQSRVLTTAYLVPPLVVALVGNGEQTALVAILSTLLSIASGVWDHYLFSGTHLYRVAVVAGSGALAVTASVLRTRAMDAKTRMGLLAEIAGIANGRDIGQSLRRLADLLVPVVADLCEIVIVEEGELRRCASRVAGAPPGLEQRLLERPVRDELVSLVSSESGAMLVGVDPGGELSVEGDHEVLRMRPAICAPVRAADRLLAILVLAVGPSGRRYGEQDLRFARTVGSRAALAIENARLMEELRGAEQRMQAIVGSLADAVTIRDISGQLVYANRAALESMGFSTLDDFRESDPEALFDRYSVTDESGAPLRMEDLPSVRLLRGEDPTPLVLRYLERATGDEYWRVLKATPLYDTDGKLEAAVTIIEDVSAAKRVELQTSFLSRASEILASSLDYEETLRNVAWLAVPEIADWCAVDLIDEHGRRQQVVAAHPDPEKLALAERLREFEADPTQLPEGTREVLRTGRSELYHEITDQMLEAAAQSPEHLALIRELQMRSVLIVPLRAGARIMGAMTLVMAESGRRFIDEDLRFAEQLATRAAVAVENSRLYTRRSQIATTLQQSLLPQALPEIAGWEVAALYRPASAGGEVEVGGDFYDGFQSEGGWIMLVGDVTGKGAEAAAMTSLVRYGARFVGEHLPDPAGILARLDEALRRQPTLSLCSALCLRIEDDRVTLASAGHPLPLLLTDEGVKTVGSSGPVLGAFTDAHWPTEEVSLRRNDVILMYTDGVTDTVGEEGRFGEQRLEQTMVDCGPVAAEELLSCIERALSKFQTGPQADDTAALALRLVMEPAASIATFPAAAEYSPASSRAAAG